MAPRKKNAKSGAPPEELSRIVQELADSNRRLLNRENELRRRQDNQEIYNRIVTGLISQRDLKETLGTALQLLCEATSSAIAALYLLAPEEQQLVPFVTCNLPEASPVYKLGEGLPGQVAKERKRLVSGDIPDNFPFKIRLERNLEVPPRAVLAIPLEASDRLLGVLVAGALSNYNAEAVELAGRVTLQMAMAVENAITFQRAVNLARELKFKSEALKKKYIELARAHQVKSAFLAGVSHELKTPLNSIIGFSRVLLRRSHGELTPGQEEYLRLILKNGEHLLSVITDMLDLSRLESGTVQLVRQDLNIVQEVEECVRSLEPQARKQNVQIAIRPGDRIPGIQADRSKLRQILFNLLSNAIKFSPPGGKVEVLVTLTEFGDEVRIAVSDQGPGVPPGDRERIFEPFVRLANDSRQEGSGLGLAVARKLTGLHGGRLRVEPGSGGGSTFILTLPAAGFELLGGGKEIVKMKWDLYE